MDDEHKDNGVKPWMFFVLFFLIALIARFWFLFNVATPDNPGAGWFGDAYHHWQIAYLTKEIGLSHGFLRLWDLKGMEFFWGLLHPLFTMLAFAITGSTSIGVERAMTGLFGSVSVALVYLNVKKYWNNQAAIAAAILAALNPVGIFNDTSGMVEPLGITFLLLGIYFFPKKPIWAGLSLALALMARAEYWLFSLGILFAMVFFAKKKIKFDNRILTVAGFAIPFLLYLKYLANYTNNAIYPFYQNFLTNILGTWQVPHPLIASDLFIKYLFLAIFIVCAAGSLYVLIKKPKGMLVYLLGLGNWLFLGATFGLGAYIYSYVDFVWYVRFMILPYIFIGILISVFLFYWIPRSRIKFLDKFKLNWLVLIAVLVAAQLVWIPIMKKYNSTQETWQQTVKMSGEIMQHYDGGGMVFLEGSPDCTYAMVKVYGFNGKNFVSEMFDPYFYFKDDPYQNWGDDRLVVLKWLKDNNIKIIVTYGGTERYAKLSELEPKYVGPGEQLKTANIVIYKVDDKKIQQDF